MNVNEALLFTVDTLEQKPVTQVAEYRHQYSDSLFKELDSRDYVSNEPKNRYFRAIVERTSLTTEDFLSDYPANPDIDLRMSSYVLNEIMPNTPMIEHLGAQIASNICTEAHLRVRHGYQDKLLNMATTQDSEDAVVTALDELFETDSYRPYNLQARAVISLSEKGPFKTIEECKHKMALFTETVMRQQDFEEVRLLQEVMGELPTAPGAIAKLGRWAKGIVRRNP